MISIYTITMGREYYLKKLIESINKNSGDIEYEHHIGFQGISPSDELMDTYLKNKKIYLWKENCGAGEANNRIIPNLKGDIIVKLDDDAVIYSPDYLIRVREISNLLNNECVFSPYPVGLINNPGGVPSKSHHVRYSKELDIYFTFRQVVHIGGFGRICPKKVVNNFIWPNDLNPSTSGNEDTSFSRYCLANNTKMYYLENGLVIEHHESTLGQHKRYEKYFGNRF